MLCRLWLRLDRQRVGDMSGMRQRHAERQMKPRGLLQVIVFVSIGVTLLTCLVGFEHGDLVNYEVKVWGGVLWLAWGDLPGWPIRPTSYAFGTDWYVPGGFGVYPIPFYGSGGASRWLYVPFWPLVVLAAGWIACPAVRSWNRHRLGLCSRCGYDLTGNESGVCPECGTISAGAQHVDR